MQTSWNMCLLIQKNLSNEGFEVVQIGKREIEEIIDALYYDAKTKMLCFEKDHFENGIKNSVNKYQEAYVSLYYDGIFSDVPMALERMFQKSFQNILNKLSEEEILERLNLDIKKENLEKVKAIYKICYDEVKNNLGSVDTTSLCYLEEKLKRIYEIEAIVAFVPYRIPDVPKVRDEKGNITEIYGKEYEELIKKANENSGIRVLALEERDDYGIAIKKEELKEIMYSLTEMPGEGKYLAATYLA